MTQAKRQFKQWCSFAANGMRPQPGSGRLSAVRCPCQTSNCAACVPRHRRELSAPFLAEDEGRGKDSARHLEAYTKAITTIYSDRFSEDEQGLTWMVLDVQLYASF